MKLNQTWIGIICVSFVGLLVGCASQQKGAALPDPRPLGSGYESISPNSVGGQRSVEPISDHFTEPLDLNQALALSLLHNPDLEAYSLDVRAAEARMLQAGFIPNPLIEFEIEEYDRGGEGFDSAEASISLGQRIELGGKRRLRKRTAEAAGILAGWDYESERLNVFAETARRFVTAAASQRRLQLADSVVGLAEETLRAVDARVKAGKEPPLQQKKAAGEFELARLGVVEARNEWKTAQSRLVAMWGGSRTEIALADGDLDKTHAILPSLQSARLHLPRNPELARLDAELSLRKITLESEKAARIPDLEAFVGYQQFEEDSTDSIKFGILVPLPLFDRNQGGISAAGNDLARVASERRSVRASLVVDIDATHARLNAAKSTIAALRGSVLPTMNSAFDAAQEGYRQGKFGYLDVLDAQRSLIDAEKGLLDALTEYHAAVIDLETLTGTGIESLINSSKEEK